jgi:Protein of unknown function (DUF3575)
MKKTIFIATFIFFSQIARSQEASVEKNLYGFQLGLLSASFQYEAKLSRKIALHFETGAALHLYEIKSYNSTVKNKTGTITTPFFSVEPRFYYGIDRRTRLNKNTSHNGSNFMSLNVVYAANDYEIANSNSNYKVVPFLSVIPTYGIRRSFAKNFNYEFLFGLGYQYNIFSKSRGCGCSHEEVNLNLQAKIGYNF